MKRKRNRFKKIERDAALRALNGNGCCPGLPTLPHCHNNEKNRNDDDFDDSNQNARLGHKYGVVPYGNILMSFLEGNTRRVNGSESRSHPDQVRHLGLGNMLCLNDEQLLIILSYMGGSTLGRVTCCSRFLYVAGHYEEIWRDLTLEKENSNPDGIDFWYSWKDTYVHHFNKGMKNRLVKGIESTVMKGSGTWPHMPITMQGVYSDVLYRPWLCRNFPLPALCANNVPVEEYQTLTTERFLRDYEEKNLPVVVKGASSSWSALKTWTDTDDLVRRTSDVIFRATSGAAPLPASFFMESYSRYCSCITAEEAPLYLFDRTFAQNCPSLHDDYFCALKKSCPYLNENAEHGHDLFSILGKDRRPDYRWIIAGPLRSGSSFHIDPNATHAWNAPIVGRKRWIFYPPGSTPPGVYPSPSGDDVIMPISLGEWFLTHWDAHVIETKNPDKSKRPFECIVHPGDIIFVPHGWWHCVLNIDDGMSIALTQNYVSQSNLPDVLRFLKKNISQVSGCRDRPEAVKADVLGEVFEEGLSKARPELLREAKVVAAQGFGCATWANKNIIENEEEIIAKKLKNPGCSMSILERAKSIINGNGKESVAGEGSEPVSSTNFSFSFL